MENKIGHREARRDAISEDEDGGNHPKMIPGAPSAPARIDKLRPAGRRTAGTQSGGYESVSADGDLGRDGGRDPTAGRPGSRRPTDRRAEDSDSNSQRREAQGPTALRSHTPCVRTASRTSPLRLSAHPTLASQPGRACAMRRGAAAAQTLPGPASEAARREG